MPGIAGIISSRPAAECEDVVQSMIGCMKHETFYVSGSFSSSDLGVYAGWVALEGSSAASQVFFNDRRDVILVLAGECFQEESPVSLYEREGIRFVEKLNGLFSGLLIDKTKQSAFLFNDRYGIERLYFTEDRHGLFFASEAKAILRVRPECRSFDDEGVAQLLNFGTTAEERTLFRNVSMMPGGSLWTFERGRVRKERYFDPKTWEAQPLLTEGQFTGEFEQTFRRILPRYFTSRQTLGLSLTGGLDTRMIMACRPDTAHTPVCFTYSGEAVDTLDARLGSRIAAACGLEHRTLRIGKDFFAGFPELADRTVYVSDGYFGVTGAHEIYMSRQARQFAAVRLTGNYGGEVLRGVSTFKPAPLAAELLNEDVRRAMTTSAQRMSTWKEHQITFAAFREVPWNLFGNLMAGRSQIGFRTPYMDNEIVALAYRAPETLRTSRSTAVRLVRDNNPALSAIPTDKGYLGNGSRLGHLIRRSFAEITFKLDYFNNEGFPHWLSTLDPLLQSAASHAGFIGLHKHLHYRSWFRNGLGEYVQGRLASGRVRESKYWNRAFVERMASDHVRGRRNFVLEINSVLTLEALERLLFANS